jgi:hypothetical protein
MRHVHAAAIMRVQGFVGQEKRHRETIERGRARRGTVSVLSDWGERVVLCGWQSREPELAGLACLLNQGNQTRVCTYQQTPRHDQLHSVVLWLLRGAGLLLCFAPGPAVVHSQHAMHTRLASARHSSHFAHSVVDLLSYPTS